MQFRYKLDKKTFKGKKAPQKRAAGEENISADQRGDNEWTDSNLLSLDNETKRPQVKEEPKDVSRRSLFGLDRLSAFAESVEEKENPESEVDEAEEEAEEATISAAEGEEAAPAEATENSEPEAEPEESSQPGFFRRVINKFKSQPEETEPAAESPVPANAASENPQAAAEPGAESVAPDAAEMLFGDLAEEEEEAEYSRRNLLRQGVHFFAKPAVATVQNKIDRVNETVDKITKRVPLIRPPGAITEQKFLQACTRCDKCIHACPKDAIQRAPKKLGFLIMGTPFIDPNKNPCVMCDDLPCIPACPDGALKPVRSHSDVKMGYAILDKAKCQAYGITFCQQCVIDCPVPGAITQTDERPVFHKDVCTGCGVCVLSCSTVNIPLAIKIKPQMVIESQIRKKKLEKERARIAAEREAQERQAAEVEENTEEEQPVVEPTAEKETE